MKRLLARCGLPKAIGLYIDDHVVTLSQVVSTPFGPVEVDRGCENADPDELPDVLRRLIAPLRQRHKTCRVPVAVGLPACRVYFATRPIQDTRGDPAPQVLLREALRSSNVSINDMAVDVVKAQPDKRLVASIVSCEKKYLTGLLDSLRECDVRPLRAEPAPCALLRTAAKQHRARRNAKVVVRLFLSATRGIAVLVVDNLPVVWRPFDVVRGDEASTILSISRSLLTVSRDCGIESDLDAVMLHGCPDLTRLLDLNWLQGELGAGVDWFDGPALDNSAVAFGLALGGLKQGEQAFDLARTLKPRPLLRELFPWHEAALQALLLACMAVLLFVRSHTLNASYATVGAQATRHPWMESLQEPELEKEKNELKAKVAAVRKFLGSRITWTPYARGLAACMPPNVFLTSFQGDCELESGGKEKGQAKSKKSLVLRGAVLIPEDGLVPHEIDRFLNTLREHPMLKRDFPLVELADLKQLEQTDATPALALFTVICLPKAVKSTPE